MKMFLRYNSTYAIIDSFGCSLDDNLVNLHIEALYKGNHIILFELCPLDIVQSPIRLKGWVLERLDRNYDFKFVDIYTKNRIKRLFEMKEKSYLYDYKIINKDIYYPDMGTYNPLFF